MHSPIRVFVSDPHPVVRAGLNAFLNTCDEFNVVGDCGGLTEIRLHCEKLRPDVVLVGHSLYQLDWSGLVARHIVDSDRIRCLLICSGGMGPVHYANALRAGFRGIFLKESELESLKTAICGVHEGRLWCDHAMAGNLLESLIGAAPEQNALAQLLTRQRQIVDLVVKGQSNAEIAHDLYASQATVARDLTLIYRKLQVGSRGADGPSAGTKQTIAS